MLRKNIFYRIFLLLLFFVTAVNLSMHSCSHQNKNMKIINYQYANKINNNIATIKLKSAYNPQPIRIYVHYEDAFNKLSNFENFKNLIINPAVTFWKEIVKVKYPLQEPILLDRLCVDNDYDRVYFNSQVIKVCRKDCVKNISSANLRRKCYNYGQNNTIVQTGKDGQGIPNSDLVIIMDSGKNCSKYVLASAMEDRLESTYDRPIIGYLNLCPDTVDIMSNIELTIQTIEHEIMHIMGFSTSLFAYFRDENGSPLTPRDIYGDPSLGILEAEDIMAYIPNTNTLIMFNHTEMTPVGERMRRKAMLVTPNLLQEAREYYNCSTLQGMLLEDFGERGNAWSHFEMKLAFNELMAPTSSEEVYLSRLSLALLQDTGWYEINNTKGINFTFGKGLGCDFVNKNPFEYITARSLRNQSTSPWCSNVYQTICSKDRTMARSCSYKYGNNLIPDEYKYYNDKMIFSSNPFVDFTPMYLTYYTNSTLNQNCENTININRDKTLYNSYEISSKCFDLPFKIEQCTPKREHYIDGGGCYQYQCSNKYGLILKIEDEQYQCLYDNDTLEISSKQHEYILKGNVKCPKCSDFCNKISCVIAQRNKKYLFKERESLKIKYDINVSCSGVPRICSSRSSIVFAALLFKVYYSSKIFNEMILK